MRIRRHLPQLVAAFVALATALNGRASGEEGSRSFEITGSVGQDAPDIGGGGAGRRPLSVGAGAGAFTPAPPDPRRPPPPAARRPTPPPPAPRHPPPARATRDPSAHR